MEVKTLWRGEGEGAHAQMARVRTTPRTCDAQPAGMLSWEQMASSQFQAWDKRKTIAW